MRHQRIRHLELYYDAVALLRQLGLALSIVKLRRIAMSELLSEGQIAAAAAYEDLFVPALFQEWAPRLLDAATVQPGHRVLDVACGTGILAREAAARVGSTGFVAGLDLSPGMLAVAEQLAPAPTWLSASRPASRWQPAT
jgi:2-polyprenyl-3-methyl-5-hydroxy-6-metoxy-1,4-benzoquinol methylase